MFYASVNVVRLDWSLLSELYTLKKLLNYEMAKMFNLLILVFLINLVKIECSVGSMCR